MKITKPDGVVAVAFKCEDFDDNGAMIGPVFWVTANEDLEPIFTTEMGGTGWLEYAEMERLAKHFNLNVRDV